MFPNEASLLRLARAVLMEISEDWESDNVYLTLDDESKAAFAGVPWQRCQFHLQQNALQPTCATVPQFKRDS